MTVAGGLVVVRRRNLSLRASHRPRGPQDEDQEPRHQHHAGPAAAPGTDLARCQPLVDGGGAGAGQEGSVAQCRDAQSADALSDQAAQPRRAAQAAGRAARDPRLHGRDRDRARRRRPEVGQLRGSDRPGRHGRVRRVHDLAGGHSRRPARVVR